MRLVCERERADVCGCLRREDTLIASGKLYAADTEFWRRPRYTYGSVGTVYVQRPLAMSNVGRTSFLLYILRMIPHTTAWPVKIL